LIAIFFQKLVSKLRSLLASDQGQVSEKHEVGRWIRLLSSLDEVSTIMEIGTWNGLGTSKMIALGVESRVSQKEVEVLGLEANKRLFSKAESNLKEYGFYKVIHGTIVTEDQLDTSELSEREKEWILSDITDLGSTPLVLNRIPLKIDLLVLDGGEFSTYAEFKLLQNRVSKWIILDDTNTRKCRRILEEVGIDSQFSIVWSSDERNGTAVMLRKPKSNSNRS
jgi:hypothetical protein